MGWWNREKKKFILRFFTACHFTTHKSQDLGIQSQKDLVLEEKDIKVELYKNERRL